ncbi:MAG: hypothetical protein ACI87E_002631 [Mariniblastus sp.]|jgi:hypothetical protein
MGRRTGQKKLKAEHQRGQSRFVLPGVVLLVLVGIVVVVVIQGDWFSKSTTENSTPLPPPTKSEGQLPGNPGLSWKAMDNPTKDGWTTEAFSAEAGTFLKKLGALFLERPDSVQLHPMVAAQFSCTPLMPSDRKIVLSDQTLVVERLAPPEQIVGADAAQSHSGSDGLALAVNSLLAPFDGAKDIRWKFKVIRVGIDGESMVTQQFVSLSGRTSDSVIEQNATWLIHWQAAQEESPRLESIQVTDFEQVTYKQSGETMFADCTQSVLGQNACYQSQMMRGMNHWLDQSQDTRYFNLLGNPGMAVGDVNGDGLDDLYVCQEEGLPNRLFLQSADGSAVDVSEQWGVNWLHNSRGALLVDLDNDADQDLVVAMVGHVIVASNDGKQFKIRNILPTDDDNMSLSAADYDNDGDLDIYVCALNKKMKLRGDASGSGSVAGLAASGDDELDGGRNVLFRNQINTQAEWSFVDVTEAAGLDTLNQRMSYSASWEDYDNDGDVDLYVANDYGQNNLFRNDDGRFTDVTSTTGSTDTAFGMSASWGDFDRDGWMDIYVSNMFSAAGSRVTHQDKFLQDAPEAKQRLQRFAKGNTLLRSEGSGKGFTDVSEQEAVAVGRWAWGSNFVDINNDGWDDIVVANGFLTTDDTSDL